MACATPVVAPISASLPPLGAARSLLTRLARIIKAPLLHDTERQRPPVHQRRRIRTYRASDSSSEGREAYGNTRLLLNKTSERPGWFSRFSSNSLSELPDTSSSLSAHPAQPLTLGSAGRSAGAAGPRA